MLEMSESDQDDGPVQQQTKPKFPINTFKFQPSGLEAQPMSQDVKNQFTSSTSAYVFSQKTTQQSAPPVKIDSKVQHILDRTAEGFAIRNDKSMYMNDNTVLIKTSSLLQQVIQSLTDLIKQNVHKLYPEQFLEVKDLINQSFEKKENNSLVLLSRSKQTVHAFLNKLGQEVSAKNLKIVRVNSILNNSEGKILQKFCDALKLKSNNKNYSMEMI